MKTRFLFSNFFSKMLPLRAKAEKYVTARGATDDNIILRKRFACWITKATHTHTQNI